MKHREFTCILCGAKCIDKGRSQSAKFCSNRCRDRAYRRGINQDNRTKCMHNDGVICNDHKCDGCGWNPEVQKARKEKVYGKE